MTTGEECAIPSNVNASVSSNYPSASTVLIGPLSSDASVGPPLPAELVFTGGNASTYYVVISLPTAFEWLSGASNIASFFAEPSSLGAVANVAFEVLELNTVAVVELRFVSESVDTSTEQVLRVGFRGSALRGVECAQSDAAFSLRVVIGARRRSTLSEATVVAVTATAVATSVVAASIGSPTSALQQIRVTGLLGLGECVYADASPLMFSESPLQLAVGRASGRYWRGAVVGGIVLFVSIFLAGCVVVGVLVMIRSYRGRLVAADADTMRSRSAAESRWVRVCNAAADFHFPGLLMLPVVLGLQSVVCASVELLQLDAVDGGDVITGLVGLGACAAAIGLAYCVTSRWLDCHIVQRGVEHNHIVRMLGETPLTKFLVWALVSDAKWTNSGRGELLYKQHFLLVFGEYRVAPYILFELGLSYAMGIVLGIRNSTSGACLAQAVLLFLLNAASVVVTVWYHPALCRATHAFMLLTSVISCVCAMTSFGNVLSDSDAWGMIGDRLSVVITVLVDAKLALDLLMVLLFAVAFVKFGGESMRNRRANRFSSLETNMGDKELPLLRIHHEMPTSDSSEGPIFNEAMNEDLTSNQSVHVDPVAEDDVEL